MLAEHDLAFTPVDNPYIARQIGPGRNYFRATSGFCDCGTALGDAAFEDAPPKAARPVAKLKQMRKKGWSEAKISRWLAQREEYLSEKAEGPDTADLDRWRSFLKAMIAARFGPVGVLIHDYRYSVDDEKFSIGSTVRHRTASLTNDDLYQLSYDDLHEFR